MPGSKEAIELWLAKRDASLKKQGGREILPGVFWPWHNKRIQTRAKMKEPERRNLLAAFNAATETDEVVETGSLWNRLQAEETAASKPCEDHTETDEVVETGSLWNRLQAEEAAASVPREEHTETDEVVETGSLWNRLQAEEAAASVPREEHAETDEVVETGSLWNKLQAEEAAASEPCEDHTETDEVVETGPLWNRLQAEEAAASVACEDQEDLMPSVSTVPSASAASVFSLPHQDVALRSSPEKVQGPHCELSAPSTGRRKRKREQKASMSAPTVGDTEETKGISSSETGSSHAKAEVDLLRVQDGSSIITKPPKALWKPSQEFLDKLRTELKAFFKKNGRAPTRCQRESQSERQLARQLNNLAANSSLDVAAFLASCGCSTADSSHAKAKEHVVQEHDGSSTVTNPTAVWKPSQEWLDNLRTKLDVFFKENGRAPNRHKNNSQSERQLAKQLDNLAHRSLLDQRQVAELYAIGGPPKKKAKKIGLSPKAIKKLCLSPKLKKIRSPVKSKRISRKL